MQDNGKPGYACGWQDACEFVIAMIEKEQHGKERQLGGSDQ